MFAGSSEEMAEFQVVILVDLEDEKLFPLIENTPR